MKSIEWIDKLKKAKNLPSDRQAALMIGMQVQAMSKHRNGHSVTLDDKYAQRLEELLELPAGTIIADQHKEREKDPAIKAIWERLGKLAAGAAHAGVAGAALTICLSGAAGKAEANQIVTTTSQSAANIHYAQLIGCALSPEEI